MARTANLSNKTPLGIIVIARLKELNISQKQLSILSSTSKTYLCNVLSGRKRPTIRFLRKISSHTGLDIFELVKALLEYEEGEHR